MPIVSEQNAKPPETENFANHPKSVTEMRADKNQSGGDWTPRDVLISVLRQIDEGKIKPQTLIVSFTDTPEEPSGIPPVCWEVASKGVTPVLGLLSRVSHRINAQYDLN